jgi:hypothetical protein
MVASISLTEDGIEPKKNEILDLLKENNVIFGIQGEAIDQLVANPVYSKEVPIAYGIASRAGESGKFVLLAKKSHQNVNLDYVNLRERTNIITVDENEILAEIVPPTIGEVGKNIFGEELPGIQGEKANIGTGKNVLIDENNKIISKISGELIFKDEGNKKYYIDVSKVYTVKGDVDYSTGNIRFPGKVVVMGNVNPGFVVEAEEDIEIKNNVEAATLISGGTIKVGGIKGGNKGIIKCVNLFTNFIENASIEADNDVIVKISVINSIIKAGNNIVVTDRGGRIAGGESIAGYRLESDNIGSKINVKTMTQVGVPPTLNDELILIESQIKIDIENLRKLSLILKGMIKLKKEGNLDQSKFEQYKKTLETAKQLKSALAKNEVKLDQIKENIEKSKRGGLIIVRNTVFPGTEIIIHKKKFFPSKEMSKTIFTLEEDKIVMRGYSGEKDGAV